MTITDILDQLGIRYMQPGEAQSVRSGWVGVPCPYCGHGSGDSYLGFPVDGRACSCWYCGPHRLGKTLHLLSGRPWDQIIKLIGDIDRAPSKRTEHTGVLKLPNGLLAYDAMQTTRQSWKPFAEYLSRRNIDPERTAMLWNIQGIDWKGGRLSWRLFMPIHYHGRVASWTTRTIGETSPRYISADPEDEAIPHKELLYGHDLVRHTAIVVEGPLDAIRIGPGAVATFGTGVTFAQLAKIAQFPVRAICFDNEHMAQRRAREWARALEPFPGRTEVVRLDSGNDPGDATEAEIKELRKMYLES